MKKRIEFPLVELILIIILSSVLVIFSFPKFMGVGTEVRIKALNATVLNLKSVNRLLYSRAIIHGVRENALQTTRILGENDAGAYLVYGELRAQEEDLKKFLESKSIEYVNTEKLGVLRLYLDGYQTHDCYVDYQQAKQEKMADGGLFIQTATYRVINAGC